MIKLEVIMKIAKYNDKLIYVDDSPFDEKETVIDLLNVDSVSEEEITNDDLFADTLTDLWGQDE